MIFLLIVAACFIIWMLNRKYSVPALKKKKSKMERLPIPNTERKASGYNWDTYKNSIAKSKTEKNNSVKSGPLLPINRYSKHKKMYTNANSSTSENNTDKKYIENNTDKKQNNKQSLTKHIAMDCEMVGIGDGIQSMIARVSIVNKYGNCLYDKYVKPREKVVDYRTPVSGIRPDQLRDGEDFNIVQEEVAEILKGRTLIGHALKHDLDVLYLSHPRRYLRDTSRYKPFRQLCKGSTPSLKKLACELLGREIQIGEHNSVEDARAAMQLYMLYKNKWESERKGH